MNRRKNLAFVAASLLLACAISLWAAVVAGNLHVAGKLTANEVDFASSSRVQPFPAGSTLPASCSEGAMFSLSQGSTRELYICTASGQWTPLGQNLQASADSHATPSLQKLQLMVLDLVPPGTDTALLPDTPSMLNTWLLSGSASVVRYLPGFIYGGQLTGKRWKISMRLHLSYPSANPFNSSAYAMGFGFTDQAVTDMTLNPPAAIIGVVKPENGSTLYAGSAQIGSSNPFLNQWGLLEIWSEPDTARVFLRINNGEAISFCASGCSQTLPSRSTSSTSRFVIYASRGVTANGNPTLAVAQASLWMDLR